eukprot:6174395-Pleurochrysis_carterae.AAC.1
MLQSCDLARTQRGCIHSLLGQFDSDSLRKGPLRLGGDCRTACAGAARREREMLERRMHASLVWRVLIHSTRACAHGQMWLMLFCMLLIQRGKAMLRLRCAYTLLLHGEKLLLGC